MALQAQSKGNAGPDFKAVPVGWRSSPAAACKCVPRSSIQSANEGRVFIMHHRVWRLEGTAPRKRRAGGSAHGWVVQNVRK